MYFTAHVQWTPSTLEYDTHEQVSSKENELEISVSDNFVDLADIEERLAQETPVNNCK